MNLNDLWVLYDYTLENYPIKCDIKKCDCHIKAKNSYEKSKIEASLFFGFLICGFRLDDKSSNNFWLQINDKIIDVKC